ncbi:MAG: hypothetical protein ABGX05_14670 [Pirellulaceae bacterium]
MKWLLAILYGLFVIWTGLLRGIEAQAYKPNSLWFCLAMGLLCIAAGYLFRLNKTAAATMTSLVAAAFVLSFYLYCFICKPAGDATVRVGLVIVASIGFLAMIFLPAGTKGCHKDSPD